MMSCSDHFTSKIEKLVELFKCSHCKSTKNRHYDRCASCGSLICSSCIKQIEQCSSCSRQLKNNHIECRIVPILLDAFDVLIQHSLQSTSDLTKSSLISKNFSNDTETIVNVSISDQQGMKRKLPEHGLQKSKCVADNDTDQENIEPSKVSRRNSNHTLVLDTTTLHKSHSLNSSPHLQRNMSPLRHSDYNNRSSDALEMLQRDCSSVNKPLEQISLTSTNKHCFTEISSSVSLIVKPEPKCSTTADTALHNDINDENVATKPSANDGCICKYILKNEQLICKRYNFVKFGGLSELNSDKSFIGFKTTTNSVTDQLKSGCSSIYEDRDESQIFSEQTEKCFNDRATSPIFTSYLANSMKSKRDIDVQTSFEVIEPVGTSTPINSFTCATKRQTCDLTAVELQHLIFDSPVTNSMRDSRAESDNETLTPTKLSRKSSNVSTLTSQQSLGNESSIDLFGTGAIDDMFSPLRLGSLPKQQSTSIVVVATNLTSSELDKLSVFVSKYNLRSQSVVDANSTHVITKTSIHRAYSRTLKSIQAIARKQYLLDYEWIVDCIKADKILPEVNYEMTTELNRMDKSSAPFRARTSRALLFKNHEAIFIGQSSETSIPRECYCELASLTGITVLNSTDEFSDSTSSAKVQMVLMANENDLPTRECDSLYRDRNIRCLLNSWLLDSLTSYDVQPFSSYAVYNQGF
ncbi:hypothetical protein GJ496_006592 [Pomphorhynchus laevis]|nr:hypothetical protein GJ496_006592 [Pomphorhynchus laevis]